MSAANGHGQNMSNGANGDSGNSNMNGAADVKHLPKPLPCWCTWCLMGHTA